MKAKILFIFYFFISLSFHTQAIEHRLGNSVVHEHSPSFYTGKIKDRDLWVVMEQVTAENLEDWQRYATVQSTKCIARKVHGINPRSGSLHFNIILSKPDLNKNQIWVVYITSMPNPKYNPAKFNDYIYGHTHEDFVLETPSFASHMKMFVTVTTRPNAKITNHLGIAVTLESTFFEKEKDLSMSIHAFAAKIMKYKNPERRFMINGPDAVMELILENNLLKKSLFIGTQEIYNDMQTRKNTSLEEYKKIENKEAEATTPKLQEEYENYKNYNGFSGLAAALYEMTHKKEENYKRIYSYNQELMWPACDAMLKEHPPILSMKGRKTWNDSADRLDIFEPKAPDSIWLSILPGDPDHDWLLNDPYLPSGFTHFIAADLQALAESRATE